MEKSTYSRKEYTVERYNSDIGSNVMFRVIFSYDNDELTQVQIIRTQPGFNQDIVFAKDEFDAVLAFLQEVDEAMINEEENK